MASSGPPGDDEHGDVQITQIRQAIASIHTIIGADPRTFSKKRANDVSLHLAMIEGQFLKLCQNVDQMKTRLEAQSLNACSQNCSHTKTADQGSTPPLFSAVAALPPRVSVPPPKATLDPLCTVKVYPKATTCEPAITSAETTKQIVQCIDLKGKNIGIKNIKSINNNGVSILCRTQNEAKTLAEVIRAKVDSQVDIKTHTKRNPTLTMLLQGKDHVLGDLKEDILLKNNIPGGADSIDLVNLRGTDNGNTVVVMVVSPETYKALAANDFKLYVGWTRVKLRERDPISQCWSCHRFGHESWKCRFQIDGKSVSICSRCGKNHKNDEEACKADLCCPLCTHHNTFAEKRGWKKLDTKHGARFAVCPIRVRALGRAKALINYG